MVLMWPRYQRVARIISLQQLTTFPMQLNPSRLIFPLPVIISDHCLWFCGSVNPMAHFAGWLLKILAMMTMSRDFRTLLNPLEVAPGPVVWEMTDRLLTTMLLFMSVFRKRG